MIVGNDVTRDEALKLLQDSGKVYYSDKFRYSAVVLSSTVLDRYIISALERGEIAIVGTELQRMEHFDYELKRFKDIQHKQEMKDAHAWFKAHPNEVAKVIRRVEARERANVTSI